MAAKAGKTHFERNFFANKKKKQETRGNNSTKVTLLVVFQKNVGKIADFCVQFSFKVIVENKCLIVVFTLSLKP